MRDVFKTKKKRSEVMSRIRSKHTKLDTAMKALLEREGRARTFGNKIKDLSQLSVVAMRVFHHEHT